MIRFVPNIVTLIRLLLTCVFLVMIINIPEIQPSRRGLFVDMVFVLFLITALTDIVDGIIARSYNVVSKFGRILDPLVDKVLICGGFICLAIIGEPKLFDLPALVLAVIQWGIAGVITVREMIRTVTRHIAESQGINFAATAAGKVKMLVQSIAIGTILIKIAHFQNAAWANWFTLIMMLFAAAITVIASLPAKQVETSTSSTAVTK
jgi:CDP-diacylglycerol---glycerol-3-phosphate 3-phosphatidyltransferase